MKRSKPQIFLVDDEELVRDVIKDTLGQAGVEVTAFASAAECLDWLHSNACDLIITDVRMKGIDGIDLLTRIKELVPSLPVILITGYGNVSMAVDTMKQGACNFIEKPIRRANLLSAVDSALAEHPGPHLRVWEMLTKTEAAILRLIHKGKSTSEMATLLNRSRRTIEDHRRHIMRKIGVDNVVTLVNKTAWVRIYEPRDSRQ
jgi:FixJ family two-component response regulator